MHKIHEEPFGRFRPFTVGFDKMFAQLDTLSMAPSNNYPPYNIVKVSDIGFVVELAVAGFSKDSFTVKLKNKQLFVDGEIKAGDTPEREYIHKGIAGRSFSRTFALAEHVKVDGAEYQNGILSIFLVRDIPEEEKPIEIKVK
jgi:molecular chaperone IbpA|tara:strand:+ start:17444 stop:17869 length:426 start_codon:yes stop_codon:yes gene_type:complete